MTQLYAILVDVEGEFDSETHFSGMVHSGDEASAQSVVNRLNANLELLKGYFFEQRKLRDQKNQELSAIIAEYFEKNPQAKVKIPKGPAKVTTDEDRAKVREIEALKAKRDMQTQQQATLFDDHRKAIEQECSAYFVSLIKDMEFVNKSVELRWSNRHYLSPNEYCFQPTVSV